MNHCSEMLRLIKIVPRVNARKYGKQWIVNRDAMLRDIEECRVILGGCVVCGDDPKFHCNDCKYDWR